jgi:hypothetical protein
MNAIRSTIAGVAVLLGGLAAVVGTAHVIEAAQPQPVTAVVAYDPVGHCWVTRACQD